jgi:hypothetical protein
MEREKHHGCRDGRGFGVCNQLIPSPRVYTWWLGEQGQRVEGIRITNGHMVIGSLVNKGREWKAHGYPTDIWPLVVG